MSVHSKPFIIDLPSDESCSEQHSGYEEFGNLVRSGIERGLNNDINEFSQKPGTVTAASSRRVEQFRRWFVRIFDVWYTDVTEASEKETILRNS